MKLEIKIIRDNGSVIFHTVTDALQEFNWYPTPDCEPVESGRALTSFYYHPEVKDYYMMKIRAQRRRRVGQESGREMKPVLKHCNCIKGGKLNRSWWRCPVHGNPACTCGNDY